MSRHSRIARRRVALLACVLGSLSWAAPTGPDDLSPEQQLADLWALAETLEIQHPGLHRYTSAETWNEEIERRSDEIVEPAAPLAFYRDLSRLVAQVRCGHTVVLPPRSVLGELADGRRFFPLRVRRLGGRWIVTDRSPQAPDVAPGTELLAIDGEPMRGIEQEITSCMSGDGFIATGIEHQLSSDFAQNYALYASGEGPKFQVTLRAPGGDEQRASVEAVTSHARYAGEDDEPEPYRYVPAGPDDFAYLDVRFFGADGFEGFLSQTFEDLAKRETPALVLDLRGNGGGRDDHGALLCSYFFDAPFGYFDRIEVTADYDGDGGVVDAPDGSRRVTGHPSLGPQAPSRPTFEGDLYVLIDGGTFSTAADVATVLHHGGRATFLGRESGGGYDGNTSGVSTTLVLPESGIRVSVPRWMYTTANVGHAHAGRGVPVDHVIEPTWESVRDGVDLGLAEVRALRKGRDADRSDR